MRLTHLAFGACALLVVWQFVSSRPVDHGPGEIAADDPLQSQIDAPRTLTRGDFNVIPRAHFSAEVRVLSRERYRIGPLADVAPLDIAVGWGPMSDSAVLAKIDISQSGRFYFWHYDAAPPIPPRDIISHSANWHLVPASDAVWSKLDDLRAGDVVKLEGMLVNLEDPGVVTMTTSLSRDDSGAGACEIIYVEQATIRKR
jgi:hypothetical protein